MLFGHVILILIEIHKTLNKSILFELLGKVIYN